MHTLDRRPPFAGERKLSPGRAGFGERSCFRRLLKAAALCSTALVPASPALAGEGSLAPETVLITARPPDPVGNTAFSTTLLDEQQLQLSPQLDYALRQVPGLSLFRRNSSVSANPSVQGVSLRSIAGSGAGR